MKSCVQITPTYPPEISGVGDYAAALSQKFDEACNPIATLVARPSIGATKPDGNVSVLTRSDGKALAREIERHDCVLLHFSGYGYARCGLCR